jgi:hypothetical protein
MLEQAIVDANALKEAAIKNAEYEVLEKYSKDIKEAVNALLEQDEEDPLGEEEADLELEDAPADELGAEPTEEEPVLDTLPPAAAAGEKLCPCPEDDEVVEVDLEQLMAQAGEEEPEAGELAGSEELAADIEDEEELRGLVQEVTNEEDEEIDLSEADLLGLVEKLVFEYEPKPTGYASGTPVADLEQGQLVQRIQREIEEANEEKEDLKEGLNALNKENKKFKRIILQLKDRLDEITVSNARLLYTNRVLGNDSLNERQKSKIVETISKAQTIEEAKMIHEALQSAVDGVTSRKKGPESLNEAVSKQSTMIFSRPARSENIASDPAMERMQRLAGIKN